MKMPSLALAMTIAATSGIAQAAAPEQDMPQHQMTMRPAASQTRYEGTGLIKEVNAKAGKILIAHEPIALLHWPAMTMWLTLQAPLPYGIKVGDRVHFELEQTHSKAWVITHVESKP